MRKWKDTLCQLFGKAPVPKGKDVAQNIYAFRFVLFCLFIYSADFIMYMLVIFIVDKKIFLAGYVAACFFCCNSYGFVNGIWIGASGDKVYQYCGYHVYYQCGQYFFNIPYGDYSYGANCNCRDVHFEKHI